MFKKSAKTLIDWFNRLSPYAINISRPSVKPDRNGVNLNIGAGGSNLYGFINLDLPSNWYDSKKSSTFIKYDIRSDFIPFDDDSVDNIYCSHVIEHIEPVYVENFLKEARRVLKNGGVLRISCPDAEFLWKVSMKESNYWGWLREYYITNSSLEDTSLLTPADCLIHVVASRKCRFFPLTTSQPVVDQPVSPETIDFDRPYDQQLDALTGDLKFDLRFVHTHISWWDFNKIAELSVGAGFTWVLRSKYQGSISAQMIGVDIDRTHPEMSLYVDCKK